MKYILQVGSLLEAFSSHVMACTQAPDSFDARKATGHGHSSHRTSCADVLSERTAFELQCLLAICSPTAANLASFRLNGYPLSRSSYSYIIIHFLHLISRRWQHVCWPALPYSSITKRLHRRGPVFGLCHLYSFRYVLHGRMLLRSR